MERKKKGTADRIVTTLIRWIDRPQLEVSAAPRDGVPAKFHSAIVLLTTFEIAQRAENHPRLAIPTILLASAAAEAFIHEFAAHIDRCHKAHDWSPESITPNLVAAAGAILNTRGPAIDKYVAAAAALGNPFDAGSRVLKDAGRLMGLQQCIVGCGPESRAEMLTDELASRGLAGAKHPDQLPWFPRLQTPEVAAWARRSACSLIVATLDLIPVAAIDPVREVQELYLRLHNTAD